MNATFMLCMSDMTQTGAARLRTGAAGARLTTGRIATGARLATGMAPDEGVARRPLISRVSRDKTSTRTSLPPYGVPFLLGWSWLPT